MKAILRTCSAWIAIAAMLQPPLAIARTMSAPLINPQPDPRGDVAKVFVAPAHDPGLPEAEMVKLLRAHVKYVFVLFQENRSFDSYFGSFRGANGLFSDGRRQRAPAQTPGFRQEIINTDGTTGEVRPFRIGPAQHAADTDDVDHSHVRMAEKMDLHGLTAKMDKFALIEEKKYTPAGSNHPPLKAKQMAELTMAYEDCDTLPFLWNYADRFALFDNIFQTTIGPSTPNAIAMISGQTGETQWVKHPEEAHQGPTTVPVMADNIPFWGSKLDKTTGPQRQPANLVGESGKGGKNVALNLTFASLPLTFAGRSLAEVTEKDIAAQSDLADVQKDIPFITHDRKAALNWGWYQEGYDREPNEPANAPPGGSHDSYIGHHNGPQYFGYISNNPLMTDHEHGLGDFFADMAAKRLPSSGVFYVRGGYNAINGMKPAWNDGSPQANEVQKLFQGDDDHPGYSDVGISQALVAREVNAIARSPYWKNSAIIITYDESEGDYDHVPPRILSFDPSGLPLSRGPRIPLILISPYARAHVVSHEEGDHNSVIKLIDALFNIPPLADLPDELQARLDGADPNFNGPNGFKQTNLGPHDARTPGTGNLFSAFDPLRLEGKVPPLPARYAEIPDKVVNTLPAYGGHGCRAIGLTTEDRVQNIANHIPADFNPRPLSNPTPVPQAPVPQAPVTQAPVSQAPVPQAPAQPKAAPAVPAQQ
ncbi:MAG: phosphoesterase [Proteobacteria bacterium]|nr:phosphoesterase [Pseudomonadota bacterium]